MPARKSRWQEQHAFCQETITRQRAEIDRRDARVMYLERLLDRAYIWLHNPYSPQQSAEECARFSTLVNEVQLVIQYLKDEDDPPVALPCASCDGDGCPNCAMAAIEREHR